jgi:hypothetical protein
MRRPRDLHERLKATFQGRLFQAGLGRAIGFILPDIGGR